MLQYRSKRRSFWLVHNDRFYRGYRCHLVYLYVTIRGHNKDRVQTVIRIWQLRTTVLYVLVTVHRDMWPCIMTNFFLIKPTDALISPNLFLSRNSTCFVAVPLPIIRSFPLHIRHWYVIQVWRQISSTTWSCLKAVTKAVWHIAVPNVQWKTPDDGQRNCPETSRVSWQK